jgi:hypothetical protein
MNHMIHPEITIVPNKNIITLTRNILKMKRLCRKLVVLEINSDVHGKIMSFANAAITGREATQSKI